MDQIVKLLTVLFAVSSLFYLYLALPMRKKAGAGQLDLGDDDVARLPDFVHMLRLDGTAVPPSMTPMAKQLRREGFEDAGTHALEGIPGVAVGLFAHPAQSMYCSIWAHETAGSWFEFSCNYPGGNTTTFTTLTGAGFGGHPGHTIVRAPGCTLRDLYERARRERPRGVFLPASAAQAVGDFEQGYARWMLWRRGHGEAVRAA